jgi:riboflavin kinase / FMN adenylyltransferase
MSVIFGLPEDRAENRFAAAAIGVFDGVHWGHRAIFQQLVEAATEEDLISTALTFRRHPAEIISPERAPKYILTLDQRVETILSLGVERVIVFDFESVRQLSATDFLNSILVGKLGARALVVGGNFMFGNDREGNTKFLARECPPLGIELMVVPSVIVDSAPVSSTRIRELLIRGEVEQASKLLAVPFVLRGKVADGRRVGRELGFPTANLEVGDRQQLPSNGVYKVSVELSGREYTGLCSIGVKPTFADQSLTVEVHLMGFRGNLYGQVLNVAFLQRLRGEMKFDSREELVEQIREDVRRVTERQSMPREPLDSHDLSYNRGERSGD